MDNYKEYLQNRMAEFYITLYKSNNIELTEDRLFYIKEESKIYTDCNPELANRNICDDIQRIKESR